MPTNDCPNGNTVCVPRTSLSCNNCSSDELIRARDAALLLARKMDESVKRLKAKNIKEDATKLLQILSSQEFDDFYTDELRPAE